MMYRIFGFCVVIGLFSPLASAQDVAAYLEGMQVRHIGPGTMSGRVTALAVERDRPAVIYVGTASGGLWKSQSAGATWTPLFDEQPTQSIGSVALAPSNPDVIWVGTGEGNPRNSHSSGQGVYRSIDGGNSWECMGLTGTRNVHRIIIHPTDPSTVYVGATGSAWSANPERGVFKTSNGGQSWEHVLSVNDTTGVAEMIMDPSNPDKLFVAMWSFHREPWFFTSGGEGSGLYVTHNGAESWDRLDEESGLPAGPLGRMGLAMSPANPDVVYCLAESESGTGLYRSNDGGVKWSLVQDQSVGNRPFYYAELHVDPTDPNHLFNLYSMVDESTDGGRSFETILPYSGVHPDHHAFYIHPDDPEFMMDGNDGGLNISRDGGKTWDFVENLPLGQFYHIAIDNATPYRIYGGMQDNGSWVGPSEVWHVGGIRNEDWQEVLFGDGFDVQPIDEHAVYAMYQGGSLSRVDLRTGHSQGIQPVRPDSVPLRFAWNAALSLDPLDQNGVYFGSQFLHYSPDRGASWTVMSPDLTTNDPTKLHQAESGGLTIDATQAENHCTILCIAPVDRDEVWVGTDDGRLQHTQDGGKTWRDHGLDIKRFPEGAWIPQIHVSPHRSDEVYVVVNDYRRGNDEPFLFRTTDGGESWDRLVLDGSGVRGHALSVVQDPVAESLLFLGTEGGLYVSFDRGVNWRHWTHDFPSVPVRDMVIHPEWGDLILGTFGRAAYVMDDLAPLRALAAEGNEVLSSGLRAFKPRDAFSVNYSRPPGSRFPGDPIWEGPNRPSGANWPYFIQPDTAEAYGKNDLLTFILDASGDTIRRMEWDVEPGLNQARWNLRTDGVHWPELSVRGADVEVPGSGPVALPGTYQVIMELGQNRSSQELVIRPDPRVPFDGVAAGVAFEHVQSLAETIATADAALQFVAKAFKVIDAVSPSWSHLSSSERDSLNEITDSLRTALREVQEMWTLPSDFKGYDHVTRRMSDDLWNAMGLVEEGHIPGANAIRAAQVAEDQALKLESAVDDVYDGIWLRWLAAVHATDRSPARLLNFIGTSTSN
jgi:photosystem II stability/assembly factor-like uncharacterized protein